MQPRSAHVTRDGVDLVWWEWPGGDPPVLLLHGVANYGRYWDLVAREVAGRRRLIAPDARGHGASGRPDRGYMPEDFIADAIAILDELGIARPVVAAHSMGGTHALLLAARHPERVGALVLVDVGPETMREGSERARRLTLERPASFADPNEALRYLRDTSPGYADEVYADRLAFAFRMENSRLVWRSAPHALAQIREHRAGADRLWAALKDAPAPITVIRGTRSSVLSAATTDAMKELRPDIQLIELDAGHNVALDRPRELAEILTRTSSTPSRPPSAAS